MAIRRLGPHARKENTMSNDPKGSTGTAADLARISKKAAQSLRRAEKACKSVGGGAACKKFGLMAVEAEYATDDDALAAVPATAPPVKPPTPAAAPEPEPATYP